MSWFIVMQLCSSGDLFDYVQCGTLDNEGCIALMNGVFSALDHLHSLRIIHRDLKPENILLDAGCKPLLADMGIAAYLDDAVEMIRVRGTPGYAAPEVVTNLPYDELADIFSAGVVYYYALSCRQPFFADSRYDTLNLTAQCKVKYPKKYFQHVSTGILNMVKFCMSKDPKQRPCAKQSLEALRKILKEEKKNENENETENEIAKEETPQETVSLSVSEAASIFSGASTQHQASDSRHAAVADAFLRDLKQSSQHEADAAAFSRHMVQSSSQQERSIAGTGSDGSTGTLSAARPSSRSIDEHRPTQESAASSRHQPPLRAMDFSQDAPPISSVAMKSMAGAQDAEPPLSEVGHAMSFESGARVQPAALAGQTQATTGRSGSAASSADASDTRVPDSSPPKPGKPLEPTPPAAHVPKPPGNRFRFGRKPAGPATKPEDDAAEPLNEAPREQTPDAGRGRVLPSRVKKSLCSMPGRASRWMAGVFHKMPAPCVEDQRPAASSSVSSSHVPRPPESAPPAQGRVMSRFA